MKYKCQDQQKDLTELRLRSDVLTSTNDGLRNERDHLNVELKETRALQKSYEEKNVELNEKLTETTSEYRELKRQ